MPQKPMPECPFCTIGSAYVVPYGSGYRCNHCLGVFDPNGEALDIHEEEDDSGDDDQFVYEIYNARTGEYSYQYIPPEGFD